MRKLFLLVALLLCVSKVYAQNSVTISSTIVDQGGITWAYGNYAFDLVAPPNATWPGGPLPRHIAGNLSAAGFFSVSIPNTATIVPGPASWTVTICPWSQISVTPPAACLISTGNAFTSSQTVTLTPLALAIPGQRQLPVAAYDDSEIVAPVNPGFIYLNPVTQIYRVCLVVQSNGVCNPWGSISVAAGGGTVGSVSFPVTPSWLSATVANPTTNPAISLTPATGQTPDLVIGTCSGATVFGPCALTPTELPNNVLYNCGAWSATSTYITNCVVQFQGSSYVALAQNSGVTPGSTGSASTWAVLAAAGVNGTNGINGVNGSPGFSPNQVASGCGVEFTSNLNFTIGACTYFVGGVQFQSPLTNITLATADPTNPRQDTILVNNTGNVAVITGIPSASPNVPTVNPATQLAIDSVLVPASSPTAGNVASLLIFDECTEWTASTNNNTDVNICSTNNPYHLTKDVEFTNGALNDQVQFLDPSNGTVNLSQWNTLTFYVRSKAAWPAGVGLNIQWASSGTPQGNAVVLKDGQFNFSSTNTTTYQQVSIPVSAFGVGTVNLTSLTFSVNGTGGLGLYLDEVSLQAGLNPPTLPSNIMLYTGLYSSSVAYVTNDVTIDGANNTYIALSNNTNQPLTNTAVWQPLAKASAATTASCAQYGVAYYTSTTGISCIAPPATAGVYQIIYNPLSSAAVPPAVAQVGLGGRSLTGGATTDTVLFSDVGTCINHDQAATQSVTETLPTATTLGDPKFAYCYQNHSTHADTITPTTWTIQSGSAAAGASVAVAAGVTCRVKIDPNSATNWLADCASSGGGGITQAYQTVDNNATALTQRSVLNFIPSGGSAVNCADNSGATRTDCTFSGSLGGPLEGWRTISTYTVQDGDNHQRLRAISGTAITLPQAGGITSNPYVATRVSASAVASNPFTSSAYTPTAGNQLYVSVEIGGTTTVTSVTSGATSCTSQGTTTNGTNSLFNIFYCTNLAGGSQTLTVNFSGTPPSFSSVVAVELTGTTFDNFSGASAPPDAEISALNTAHYSPELSIAAYRTNSLDQGGFTAIDLISNGNYQAVGYKLFSNASSSFISTLGRGITQTLFSTTGTVTFTSGWWVIIENSDLTFPTVVTPTTSTINGVATLVVQPGMWCQILSNGTNYDAICGPLPNYLTNGVYEAQYAAPTGQFNTSQGAATIMNVGSAQVSNWMMSGYGDVTVIGTSCTGNPTVALNALFTDPNAASQTTVALGTWTITTNGVVGTSNFSFPPTFFRAKASTTIQFSVTYTAGTGCSPNPMVVVTPILKVL
jgi:hypothetical protein